LAWDTDHEIYVWNAADGRKVSQYKVSLVGNRSGPIAVGGGGPAYYAAISPNGEFVAFHIQDNFIAIYELETGRLIRRVGALPGNTSAIALSPDSKTIAWGESPKGNIRLVEVITGRERHTFVGHKGPLLTLAFAANGKTLVSGSRDTTALVWDLTGQHSTKSPLAKSLSPIEIEACWADLAGEDAALGYQTTRRLAAAAENAVPYLAPKLSPIPAVDEKRLARLIADLDKDEFRVRQAAAKELEEIGDAASGALRTALEGKQSLELIRRIQGLLDKLTMEWQNPRPESLRILRALETLELAATPDARAVLARLAGGAPGARLTQEAAAALDRLGR
jgi:WD domain, G-beta repeat